MAKTKDALQIINHMTGKDQELQRLIEEEAVNAQVAALIYQARLKAGLTQQQLANLVGTKQPVIARLEDAEYEGHSLTMLQRIAKALNQTLDIRFIPAKRPRLRRAA
jgi:ribosome-binding protein aMBF1 (putative translation factor)